MKNSLGKDFTIWTLLKFTFAPTMMMIFMALYTMVDGVFVSNLINDYALSAINIVYPAVSIVVAVAIMLATGGSAIIAKNMGEGKNQEARENFSLICIFGLIIGIIIAIIGMLFIDQIILLLGATDKLFDYSHDYAIIIIMFTPMAIFQMLFQNFFVTAGKPQLGLIATLIGGVANIALDYIFVAILQMGIGGAAIATGIGYSIPALYGIYYFGIKKKTTLHFVKPILRFNVLLKTCTNGSSEMITNLSISVTTFLFNIMMLKYLGENGVAAITIILYAQFLLTSIFIGYSQGVGPIFSYNYGERNYVKIKKYFKMSMLIILISSVLMMIASMQFEDLLIGIFSKPNTEVFNIAKEGFMLFAISFAFTGFNIFTSALFTAFSNGKISALISMLRTFVFLVLSILLLPQIIGYNGIWLSVPLAELLGLAISAICLVRSKNEYMYF